VSSPGPEGRAPAERLAAPDTYVAALDGVRGIAILLVMFFHTTVLATPILGGGHFDQSIWQAARAGWSGVDLFFVLSGYLITGILLDTRGREGYFKSFYARRFLRIFPLYYAFLAFVLLILPTVAPALVHDVARLRERQMWFWTYLTNIGMAIHTDWATLPHFWSLAVEEQFYLIWPTVVLLVSPVRLKWVTIWLFVIALAARIGLLMSGARAEAVFLLTPARMDTLAIGALLAVLARDPSSAGRIPQWSGRAALVGGLALLAIVVMRGTLEEYDPVVQTAGYTLLAVFFAGVVGSVAGGQSGWFGRAMEWSPLRYLGRRSYALYVIHPLVLVAARRVAVTQRLPAVLGSEILPQIAYWGLCLGGSVIAAEVSWRLLESRCLALKRYFPYPRATPTAS